MPVEAFFGMAAFAGMFVAWVVAPTFLRKRHTTRTAGPPQGQPR